MKKLQLRNIIKESIKELMTEQLAPNEGNWYQVRGWCCDGCSTPTKPINWWNVQGNWIAANGSFSGGIHTSVPPDITVGSGSPVGCVRVVNSSGGGLSVIGGHKFATHQGAKYQIVGSSGTNSANCTPIQGTFIEASGGCPYPGDVWKCVKKGNDWKFGGKCIKTPHNGANLLHQNKRVQLGLTNYPFWIQSKFHNTKQECLASGCEGLGPDDDRKTQDITPLTTDPQSKQKPCP